MVAARVEGPWLKGIVFRYLLAHAEDPSRAKGSGIPAVENFSHKAPFYDKFVKKVMDEVPGYDERKLLDTGADVPQEDFKAILRCFKELSGVWNPFHYSVFGRVIPAVQDKVTKMAAAVGVTALGPSIVISSSPRYNDDFNSDQEIVIESKPKTRRGITTATIQHYLLPSVSEPYVEMITAGIGYYDGIPKLFKWRSTGKTKILDLPFTLEELIDGDLAYANLNLEYNKDGTVLINDQNKGRKEGLQKLLEEEPIRYKEEFLARELPSFELDETSGYDGRPVIIDTDFEIDGEVIIPAGRYGMPCARYVVNVPKPNIFQRIFWAGKSAFTKDKDEYLFLGRTDEAVEASDEAHRAQLQIERTHKAERDALEAARDVEIARADAAEADLARARAESEARETAQELGNAVRLTQDVYTLAKGIGHDLRREASRQIEDDKSTLERIIQIAKDELGFKTDETLFEDNKDIHTPSLQRLLSLDSTPDSVKALFEYVLRTESRADLIHATATSLMEEIIDSSGKVILSYNTLLSPIVSHLNASYDDVDISFESDTDGVIALYGSKPSLQSALVNIITNAADASLGGHVKISAMALGHMTSINVSQTGSLSYEKALDLSTGKFVDSTREGGTGTGSQVAFGVLKASGGSIRYFPTTETTQAYARIFVPNSLPED